MPIKQFFVVALTWGALSLFAGCSDSQSDAHSTAKDPSKTIHERLAAVKDLTDQSLLADLAKNNFKDWDDESKKVRRAALEKLTDLAVLADLAGNDEDDKIRDAAIERLHATVETLTDQAALANLLKIIEDPRVCFATAKKMTEAYEKLTNQALLADVAKNAKHTGLRLMAIEKLTDQAALADVLENAQYPSDDYATYTIAGGAIEKLTDEALLANVEKSAKDMRIREMTKKQLEPLQSPIITPMAQVAQPGTNGLITLIISGEKGCELFYTINGQNPVPNKEGTYKFGTVPIQVNSGTTVKAIATRVGRKNSAVAIEQYPTK